MVTINSQWVEQIAIGVNFSFPINCTHTKNLAFESSNEENTPEFEADVQAAVTAYELAFKTNPDYSTQDLNQNTATLNVLMFSGGVGVVELTFTVEDAVVTLNQYYGFPDEMSIEDRQSSVNSQVAQYESNYKTGNNLVDL